MHSQLAALHDEDVLTSHEVRETILALATSKENIYALFSGFVGAFYSERGMASFKAAGILFNDLSQFHLKKRLDELIGILHSPEFTDWD